MAMRRDQRLRRRKDFAEAYRQGRVFSNHLLVLRVRSNGLDVTRFGFVTGKAVGGAVLRNRVKRRLRACAQALGLAPGLDLVIGARRPAASAEFAEITSAVKQLASRAGIVVFPQTETT